MTEDFGLVKRIQAERLVRTLNRLSRHTPSPRAQLHATISFPALVVALAYAGGVTEG